MSKWLDYEIPFTLIDENKNKTKFKRKHKKILKKFIEDIDIEIKKVLKELNERNNR